MGGDTNRGAYPARSPGCIARHINAVAGGAPMARGAALDTPASSFLAMPRMRMDGFGPHLDPIGPGEWRTSGTLPMAGNWVLRAGFGDDFAAGIFDAE